MVSIAATTFDSGGSAEAAPQEKAKAAVAAAMKNTTLERRFLKVMRSSVGLIVKVVYLFQILPSSRTYLKGAADDHALVAPMLGLDRDGWAS
jgi:hypothetical protein